MRRTLRGLVIGILALVVGAWLSLLPVAVGTLAAFLTMNATESYVAVEYLFLTAALPAVLALSGGDDAF